jgi:hypothetical protein
VVAETNALGVKTQIMTCQETPAPYRSCPFQRWAVLKPNRKFSNQYSRCLPASPKIPADPI